jgi:hypothetical protein
MTTQDRYSAFAGLPMQIERQNVNLSKDICGIVLHLDLTVVS